MTFPGEKTLGSASGWSLSVAKDGVPEEFGNNRVGFRIDVTCQKLPAPPNATVEAGGLALHRKDDLTFKPSGEELWCLSTPTHRPS